MEHADTLLAIFVAFTAAKVGGEVLERLGQPGVVGELIGGVVAGPAIAGWLSVGGESGRTLEVIAELGVIVLLFRVGLETEPRAMRAVGRQAAAVGVLGVALPFGLGYGLAAATGHSATESAFVATALVATSVGITARALGDLGVLHRRPSHVILGAAVIDDILGLMVLTVVVATAKDTLSVGNLVVLVLEAVVFVGAMLFLAPAVATRLAHLLEAPRTARAPFAIAMILLLGLSVAADRIGLAAIVGAFLAGAVMSATPDREKLAHQTEPVGDLLSPIFFAFTGARIDLDPFTQGDILGLALAITAVAIAGKLAGGWLGARGLSKAERLIVGVGMVPRGEVGIVVASLALSEGLVGPDLFGSVLFMVVLTTIAAPPVLSRLFARLAEPSRG